MRAMRSLTSTGAFVVAAAAAALSAVTAVEQTEVHRPLAGSWLWPSKLPSLLLARSQLIYS